MSTHDNRDKFARFLKSKEVVTWLSEFPVERTKVTYASALFRYWVESLIKTFPTLWDWIVQVKRERKSDDMTTRKAWALAVLEYMRTRKGLGNRPMATASKELLSSAVKSFLRALADEELDYDFKIGYTVEELRKKKNKKALSPEEMRKLYDACKSNRDRALILVAANGVAPAEIMQFVSTWKEWFPKSPSQLTAPFKVNLVRGKAMVSYHTTLYQDACEALRTLHEERVRKTGGQVDELFATDEGTPYTRKAYERFWENLRERTGLANHTPWERQKAHPHAVRHFFETQAKIHRVSRDVVEYALGHSGDKYGYDRSDKEKDWDTVVETEIAKMTDVLNLKTGMAQEYYENKADELKAKIAKDTYKTLIESGALKPESLTTAVLEVVAKKLGITFEKLVLMAEEDSLLLPEEVRKRVALFGVIANAVNLDTEVYHKYSEALKVLRDNSAQSSWENHTDWYLRVEIGSNEYMQALADGFKTIDSDGKMRILSKPKTAPPELDDKGKAGVTSQ